MRSVNATQQHVYDLVKQFKQSSSLCSDKLEQTANLNESRAGFADQQSPLIYFASKAKKVNIGVGKLIDTSEQYNNNHVETSGVIPSS